MLERELQQTWNLWTTKQAGLVEKLIAGIEDQIQAPTLNPSALRPAPGIAPAPAPRTGPGTGSDGLPGPPPDEDLVDVEGGPDDPLLRVARSIINVATPGTLTGDGETVGSQPQPAQGAGDDAFGAETLRRERDEARAECDRFREVCQALHSNLTAQGAELSRLRGAVEKLQQVRAENERLHGENEAHGREVARLQARIVELQVTLVETEAELDDCRDRIKAERDDWQARRQRMLDEAARRLDEQRQQFEIERRAWRDELEVHRKVEHEAESLRVKVKKLRGLYDVTRQQRDERSRKVEVLNQRCARLGAYLDEAQAEARVSELSQQAEIDRLNAALSEALEEVEAAQRREALLNEQVRALRDDPARQGEPLAETRSS